MDVASSDNFPLFPLVDITAVASTDWPSPLWALNLNNAMGTGVFISKDETRGLQSEAYCWGYGESTLCLVDPRLDNLGSSNLVNQADSLLCASTVAVTNGHALAYLLNGNQHGDCQSYSSWFGIGFDIGLLEQSLFAKFQDSERNIEIKVGPIFSLIIGAIIGHIIGTITGAIMIAIFTTPGIYAMSRIFYTCNLAIIYWIHLSLVEACFDMNSCSNRKDLTSSMEYKHATAVLRRILKISMGLLIQTYALSGMGVFLDTAWSTMRGVHNCLFRFHCYAVKVVDDKLVRLGNMCGSHGKPFTDGAHFWEETCNILELAFQHLQSPRISKVLDKQYSDMELPHVTIQMPVCKERFMDIIRPTVDSLRVAVAFYESSSGTEMIFKHDDKQLRGHKSIHGSYSTVDTQMTSMSTFANPVQTYEQLHSMSALVNTFSIRYIHSSNSQFRPFTAQCPRILKGLRLPRMLRTISIPI
ncbi:hypothetical protein EG329_006498 [Mollisiaceae sp. DMI_Dod_QoI]|nr:hypothetical protein EG329_006498 [Helotiales sp. DMI_Dod_QoI]